MERNKILINVKGSEIIVDFGDNKSAADKSRTFLEFVLNFTYLDNQNTFVLTDHTNLPTVFNKVKDFLKSRDINYSLSDSSNNFQEDLIKTEEEFNKLVIRAKDIKKHSFNELSLPNFVRKLKNYQNKSYQHLIVTRNGANFSVPGSGKTTVVYAYFKHLIDCGEIEKLLVIGPRSAFMPWEEEYVFCFEKKPNIKRISGSISSRQRIYNSISNYEIFLVTYQTAANDIEKLINFCRNSKILLVLDESHYIKRFQAGYWSERLLKLANFAERRVILSGTPAPNSYEDLWTQINFLWPKNKILGDAAKFKFMCADKNYWPKIKETIYPFYTRTSKKDLDLPEPLYQKLTVDLGIIQKEIYQSLAIKFISELNQPPHITSKLREWRKARIVRLIEASTNPSLLGKFSEEFKIPPIDSKNFSLVELIEKYSEYEIAPKFLVVLEEIKKSIQKNEKVIVWTNFVQNIKMLGKLLTHEGIKFARIYGEIPKDFSENEEDNREKEISRFKTDNKTLVLLANPAACSESISLHKVCKLALYMDRTFNCGQYLQSLDRIHRLGLEKKDKVVYKILLSKDTIDEVIHKRLIEKSHSMEKLLSDTLPLGSFDANAADVIGNESEEEVDFQITMHDLIKRYSKQV